MSQVSCPKCGRHMRNVDAMVDGRCATVPFCPHCEIDHEAAKRALRKAFAKIRDEEPQP